jgi:hypothetical protein
MVVCKMKSWLLQLLVILTATGKPIQLLVLQAVIGHAGILMLGLWCPSVYNYIHYLVTREEKQSTEVKRKPIPFIVFMHSK